MLSTERHTFLNQKRPLVLHDERGMTLIEIMIVIAIIAGLMAVLGTSANSYLQRSRVENAKIQMKEISNKLESYNLACNSYPTTDQGLKALVTNPGPDVCANWGPDAYMKKEPKDPWNRPYSYDSDGSTFSIKTLGRDKKEGGEGYDKDWSTEELE